MVFPAQPAHLCCCNNTSSSSSSLSAAAAAATAAAATIATTTTTVGQSTNQIINQKCLSSFFKVKQFSSENG